MADLGAIGVTHRQRTRVELAVWAATHAAAGAPSRAGSTRTQLLTTWSTKFSPGGSRDATLSGIARKGGLPVASAKVVLHYRRTNAAIKVTTTAGDGTFEFGGLDATDTANYYAVAFDPAATENALVLDRLTAA